MSDAMSAAQTAARDRAPWVPAIGLTLGLWAAEAALSYVSLPFGGILFALLWLLASLVVLGMSLGLAIHGLVKRAWPRAAAIVLISAAGALLVTQVDWGQVFVRSQVAWHRDSLRELAGEYTRGEVHDGSALPLSLRLLGRDGRAHVWSDDQEPPVLFLQTWQDWRAESGVGLAYFPSPPDTAVWVRTAEGDGGHPTRDLGDGWWWIE